ESWLMKKLGTKEKIMGFGHRVYKEGDSRVPVMREIARDLGKRKKRKLGSNLRETRRSHGSRKTSLRQCGSLCGSGVLDARVPTGVKHASVRRVAGGRLVRACDRATRS